MAYEQDGHLFCHQGAKKKSSAPSGDQTEWLIRIYRFCFPVINLVDFYFHWDFPFIDFVSQSK